MYTFRAKKTKDTSQRDLNRAHWLFRTKLSFIVIFLSLYDLTAIIKGFNPYIVEKFWLFNQLDFQIPIFVATAIFLMAINYPYPRLYEFLSRSLHKDTNKGMAIVAIDLSVDLMLLTLISFALGRGNPLLSLNIYLFAILICSLILTCKIGLFLAAYSTASYAALSVLEHNKIIISLYPLKLALHDEFLLIMGCAGLFFGIACISAILGSFIRANAKELIKWGNSLELKLRTVQIQVVDALLTTLAAKDPYTMKHSRNVAFYASLIAREMGLSYKEIMQIKQACKLHDIGKVGISENILNKPGKLEPHEWEIIKMHTIIGAEILSTVGFLEKVALMVKQEHERYDGKGYPAGIRGNQISLGAQIMAVADTFDVIASRRTYKTASDLKEAMKEIEANSGGQFSPVVVYAFRKVYKKYYRRIKKFVRLSETTTLDPRKHEPILVSQRVLRKLEGEK